jgi:hypothetical protein
MKLYLGGKAIWENPDRIGFVGIKARKQSLELRICERIDRERFMIAYPYIYPQHQPVLQSISRQKQVGGDIVLANLYKVTRELLDSLRGPGAPVYNPNYMQSVLRDGDLTVVASTDSNNGVYVQLAQENGKDAVLMTVGQKYSVERFSPVNHALETKLF